MSHLILLAPTQKPPPPQQGAPVIIRSQSLFDDFLQIANLYQMAFPDYQTTLKIGEIESVVDAARSFFCMVEDQYFPLEHMWDWDDSSSNYQSTIRRWIYQVPVKVVGHDQGLSPIHMTSPKELLARLSQVGNYSDEANKHKQVLRYQYPEWEWGDLLDTFRLSQVIEELDDMFLPSPFDRLPALVKYMTHETGTYFLDYTIELEHCIQWSESNFHWLKEDWEEARKIMDQSDALCRWLIKNPNELEKVWTILSVAHKRRSV